MEQAIRDFGTQFSFTPAIENAEHLPIFNPTMGWRAVVAGMGGSHLAADIFAAVYPHIPVSVHRSYGLPVGGKPGADLTLYIASSYSGNTEETLDFMKAALAAGKHVVAITTGGAMATLAREKKVPLILLPITGIQPRSALGFSLLAIAALLGGEHIVKELQVIGSAMHTDELETEGKDLAELLKGKVPVVYASEVNTSLAYNWKIKFNETGKIPAFYNTFPELNHNELAGMDVLPTTAPLSERLHFIFLEDAEDHPRIITRMTVTEQLYGERGISFSRSPLSGKHRAERMLASLVRADWAAFHTALLYRAEPEAVAIIESFKKLIGS